MTIPVIVDLKVEVNANSKLIIFAEAPAVGNNVIESTFNVPSAAFNGLIEFWSVSGGNINSHLDLTVVDEKIAYKTTSVSLYNNIKNVLSSSFDCKEAEPFKTTGNSYYNQANFGKVALGQVTNEVFGHVAATAAITNDEGFVTSILNGDLSTIWDNIYLYGSQQSITKPNLANALVRTLIKKGYNGAVEYKEYEDASELTAIVKQVIGQDPSRAKDQDNNQLAPDKRQKLVFYPLDTVYMRIDVSFPSIYLSTATTTAVTPAGLGVSTGSNASKKFDIKMVLT